MHGIRIHLRKAVRHPGVCQRAGLLGLGLAFLAIWTGMAQGDGIPARTAFSITPEVVRLIRSGQQAMYNCDFATADREIDDLIRLYPDHPVGYMYRAISVWWRCLRNRTDKSLQAEFLKYAEKGIACGETLVRNNPKDFHAQMFLAGIYGNQTRFYLTVPRSRLAAMRSGMKGDKYNRTALALKPDCVDCLIGTASYYYAPEALPPLLKQFAAALGVRGDKGKSLKELETATHKGEFVQTEAKLILLGIYYNEKWFDQYEALLTGLIHQYPGNYIFYNWYTTFCIEQKRIATGIRFLSSLLAQAATDRSFGLAKSYALLEKGKLEMEQGDRKTAFSSFSQGIETAQGDSILLAQAHLYRGFVSDLLKQRQSALQDYRAVLSLPNVEESRKQASRFVRSPYQGRL